MDKLNDITYREADGPNPPGLLTQIKQAIDELFPNATAAAGKYIKGKGEAELAKAGEIKARAIAAIAQLENERQRLIQERDAVALATETERARDQRAHEQWMYELRTQRLP